MRRGLARALLAAAIAVALFVGPEAHAQESPADRPAWRFVLSGFSRLRELRIRALTPTNAAETKFEGVGELLLAAGPNVPLTVKERLSTRKKRAEFKVSSAKGSTVKVSGVLRISTNPESIRSVSLAVKLPDRTRLRVRKVGSVEFGAVQLRDPVAVTTSIRLQMPAGALDVSTLKLSSLFGSQIAVDSTGAVPQMPIAAQGLGQTLQIQDASGTLIALAYVPPGAAGAASIDLGGESFALGLVRMVPFIQVLEPSEEAAVLASVKEHPDFDDLVADILSALATAPSKALDYETFPYIFHRAVRIGMDVLGSPRSAIRKSLPAVGDPTVADAPGPDVRLVNPRQTFYGVDFGDGRRQLLMGRDGLLKFHLSWKPWEWYEDEPPHTRDVALGDGSFTLTFYKGFNVSVPGWYDPTTAQGQASWANFLRLLSIGLKTAGLVFPGARAAADFGLSSDHIAFLISLVDLVPAGDLNGIVGSGLEHANVGDLLQRVLDYAKQPDNWQRISYWIWQEGTRFTTDADTLHATAGFLGRLGDVLPGISNAMTAWEIGDEWIPFLSDLAFAPSVVTRTVRQTNGVLELVSSAVPPTASFVVDTLNPAVGTTVAFDAAASVDPAGGALQARWDFDGDGTFDTSFSASLTTSHVYTQRGVRRPILEVRNPQGLTARAALGVLVGARDALKIVLTWGASPADLDSHLYTPVILGTSHHVYYSSKGAAASPPYAWLDLDDTTGYGPETMWIERVFDGTYSYSVYQFSSSGSLLASGAHVEVFDFEGVLARFDVPASGSGRWWNVFHYDGESGVLTPIDTIGSSQQ